jgi:hypothetical protein
MIIDKTGSYVYSNLIILGAGLVNLALLYRFTRETYGGAKS